MNRLLLAVVFCFSSFAMADDNLEIVGAPEVHFLTLLSPTGEDPLSSAIANTLDTVLSATASVCQNGAIALLQWWITPRPGRDAFTSITD